jgi:hypothetical protein
MNTFKSVELSGKVSGVGSFHQWVRPFNGKTNLRRKYDNMGMSVWEYGSMGVLCSLT